MTKAVIVGAGPAGLMAAEVLAQGGISVTVVDQKPSLGRKFLMAGKSGLNLTLDVPVADLTRKITAPAPLIAAVKDFGPAEVKSWAEGFGAEIFTGTTGRVFPKAMKASPLLRAWLARLDGLGVQFQTRWRWSGWDGADLRFDTPGGATSLSPDITILALGGASWPRLGSDGHWTAHFPREALVPFKPSNVGVTINWSAHMERHFGTPVKNIALRAGDLQGRGEIVITKAGIEGGGIYSLSPALRASKPLIIDLLPDQSQDAIAQRLSRPRGKQTVTNWLRKALKLEPVKLALLQEFARPLPDNPAEQIKALQVAVSGLQPMDTAISTTGGISFGTVDETLMLKGRPGTYVVGEMLDWDAPTGGYLLTGCFATGKWAATHALRACSNAGRERI